MEKTPSKNVTGSSQFRAGRPKSTTRTCCICCRDLLQFRKYMRVDDPTKKKLVAITGLDGVDFTVLKICITCKNKVERVPEKSRAEEFRESLEKCCSSSQLTQTPTARTKRMSKTSDSPVTQQERSSKILKKSISPICSPLPRNFPIPSPSPSPRPVNVSSRKKLCYSYRLNPTQKLHPRLIPEESAHTDLLNAIQKEDFTSVVKVCATSPELRDHFKTCIAEVISDECSSLCSRRSSSAFYDSSKTALEEWSYEKQEDELAQSAPVLLTCLKAAAVHPKLEERQKKSYKAIQPGIMMAAGTLLYLRNEHMNAQQTMTALTLKRGGASVKTVSRLKARGMSTAYTTLLNKQESFGKDFDHDVLNWKKRLEDEYKEEGELGTLAKEGNSEALHSLASLNKSRHPGYLLNGDNVDLRIKPRQLTMTDGTKDLHYYQLIAIQNRITDFSLPNSHPSANIKAVPLTTFLPSVEDNQMLRSEWATLVGQVVAKNIPSLNWMGSFVPEHIHHKYMKMTKKKSHIVNLGVFMDNENTNEGMVAILDKMNKYIPLLPNGKQLPLISGGDLLTCERQLNTKLDRQDSSSSTAKWDGVVPVIDDFHTMANFLEVIWRLMYSTSSSRDTGTLFAARNFLKAYNISSQPMKDVNASVEFLNKYTDSLIVCAALQHFDMENVDSPPKKNTFDMMTMEPMQYVQEQLEHIVDKFAIHEGPDYNTPTKLRCPHCPKEYVQQRGLRNHMQKKHSTEPPKSADTAQEDSIFNYSCSALSLCLLFRNFEDARQLADGERLIRLYKFLMLYFKLVEKTKYAYHSFRLLAQVKCLLSPRLSHQLIWNRCVNNSGKIDSNVEIDREIEHHNRVFKEECKHFRGKVSAASVKRISHSAQICDKILQQCDKESQVRKKSGKHKGKDVTTDVQKLAYHLLKEQVFQERIPRQHHAFPTFARNPLRGLNLLSLHTWMASKIKEFASQSVQ